MSHGEYDDPISIGQNLQPRMVECIRQEVCHRFDFHRNVYRDDISYGCISTT